MKIVKVSNWTDGWIFATLLVPKEHSRDNLRTGLLFPTMANECLSQLTKQSETRHTFPLIVRNSVTQKYDSSSLSPLADLRGTRAEILECSGHFSILGTYSHPDITFVVSILNTVIHFGAA